MSKNIEEINLEDIVDGIGHAPNTERAKIQYLKKLASDEELVIEIIEYTPTEELPIIQAGSVTIPGRDKESDNHIRLKAAMAQYLSQTGSEPVFEQRRWYGVADVGSKDENRAVECGSVRVGKLIEAFGYESKMQFLGEINPAYGCLDEMLYVPYSLNSDYPPVTIISIKTK